MRVTIEKLAPTGEGIARTPDGVGFVAGALPGEEVEAQVRQVRKNLWKGTAVEVHRASLDRLFGSHASCAGCDWAYFERGAALEAKRALFLETMERIGGHSPAEFCPLPAEPSPVRYRSRCRLHVSGAGCETVLGYFAARSHRVEPLTDCEAISKETVDLLPRIRDAIAASGARVREVALLESADSRQHIGRFVLDGDWASSRRVSACLSSILDGVCVEQEEPALRLEEGERRIVADVGGRLFPLSVDTFFQANRYLVPRLFDDVRRAAREVPSGRGLDAYGGTGLFAAALLDAGHEVTTVEASPGAVRDARAAHSLWPDGERWNIVASTVSSFAARERTGFDLAVVDPPRAGLGRELAALLAGHVRHRIIYISCEPATLARDLPAILARNYRISSARLYDLFAGTHRVEAMVTLERKDRA